MKVKRHKMEILLPKCCRYIIVFSKNGHKKKKNIAINPLYDLRSEYDEHYSLYLKKRWGYWTTKELYGL